MKFGWRFLFYFVICALAALPIAALVTYEVGSLLGYQMSFTLSSAGLATGGQPLTEKDRIALLLVGPFTNLSVSLLALVLAYALPRFMDFFGALSLSHNYARALPEATSLLTSQPDPYNLDVIRAAGLLGWPTWSLVLSLFPIYIFALFLATRMVEGGDPVKLLLLISTVAIGLIINMAIHIVAPVAFQL